MSVQEQERLNEVAEIEQEVMPLRCMKLDPAMKEERDQERHPEDVHFMRADEHEVLGGAHEHHARNEGAIGMRGGG